MAKKQFVTVKESKHWNHGDRLQVAQLTLDPTTNGGWNAEITPEQFAHILAGLKIPMQAIWYRGKLSGTLSLNPCTEEVGLLHFTHNGSLPQTEHAAVLDRFLKRHRHLQIYAVVTRPGLARIARSYGFTPVPTSELTAHFSEVMLTIVNSGEKPYCLQWSGNHV